MAQDPNQPTYFVAITRLRVRHWRYLPAFYAYTFLSAWQAKRAGSVAVSLLQDANHTYWTRTVWASEAAMRKFMLAGPHRKAMPHLQNWCDEAAVAHWTQNGSQPPTWQQAHQHLQQDGRPSKINHPSGAHSKFEIPSPRAK